MTKDDLFVEAVRQDAGRWLGRVKASKPPMKVVWCGDRIHRTKRAALYEALMKADELKRGPA